MNYYEKIKRLLESSYCNNDIRIKFALYCAQDLDKYYDIKKYKDVYNARRKCLDLVASYLLNKNSVSIKDLNAAANAANAAANAANAANAADAAADAADAAANAAAHAAHAANAAANAANAAYAASYAANAAAYAAVSAAYADYEKFKDNIYREQYIYLLQITKLNSKLYELVAG